MANLIDASNNNDTLSLDNPITILTNPNTNTVQEFTQDPICPDLDHSNDLPFFIVRCFTLFFCLVGIIIILVNLCRGNRLKSWPLYLFVTSSVFFWVAMTLYQDKIDEFCLFKFRDELEPLALSIYVCVRNFLHGLSLFLILILLAHLSDIENRSKWVGLILCSILIPLAFSVGLLVFDLQVKNLDNWFDSQNLTGNAWSNEDKFKIYIGIDSAKLFLYNIITTFLLFFMSKSFCTSRLYGTFSEKRNEIVIVVTRWTYAFLLIHNLVAIAIYVIDVVVKVSDWKLIGNGLVIEDYLMLTIRILEEVEMFTVILSVPMSYVFGMTVHCCCGVKESRDMEMNYLSQSAYH